MNPLDTDGKPAVQWVRCLRALMYFPAARDAAYKLPSAAWPDGFVRGCAAWLLAGGREPVGFHDSALWLAALELNGRPHNEPDALYMLGLVPEWHKAEQKRQAILKVAQAGESWDRAARTEENRKANYLAALSRLHTLDARE